MSNMDTRTWEQELLNEAVEYPGHPVVLACMVMDRYPDLETAMRREPGREFANALRDSFIPGAGCAVHAALDTLRYALTIGLDAAYAHADRYWASWERQDSANAARAASGRKQGERLKNRFECLLNTWGTENDPGSPFRTRPFSQSA